MTNHINPPIKTIKPKIMSTFGFCFRILLPLIPIVIPMNNAQTSINIIPNHTNGADLV